MHSLTHEKGGREGGREGGEGGGGTPKCHSWVVDSGWMCVGHVSAYGNYTEYVERAAMRWLAACFTHSRTLREMVSRGVYTL